MWITVLSARRGQLPTTAAAARMASGEALVLTWTTGQVDARRCLFDEAYELFA